MGKTLRNASVDHATETTADYTIALDISCRDLSASGPKGLMRLCGAKGRRL